MLGRGLDEAENLPIYLERAEHFLRSVSGDFELIVVDDGSRDGMWELACEARKTRPWLTLLRNERNFGAAYAAKRAIRASTKDYVFWQTVAGPTTSAACRKHFRCCRSSTSCRACGSTR